MVWHSSEYWCLLSLGTPFRGWQMCSGRLSNETHLPSARVICQAWATLSVRRASRALLSEGPRGIWSLKRRKLACGRPGLAPQCVDGRRCTALEVPGGSFHASHQHVPQVPRYEPEL
eukprot:2931232-Rhodomonas_salina.3